MINVFNLRNPIRGQKGFTLVEVIVVAIIVAALAAVAIPLYTSYVSSSRKNAAANTAGSVASFCGACKNSAGVSAITDNTASGGGGSVACKPTVSPADSSRIQIPTDIKVTVTAPATGAGKVHAEHAADAADSANFNF